MDFNIGIEKKKLNYKFVGFLLVIKIFDMLKIFNLTFCPHVFLLQLIRSFNSLFHELFEALYFFYFLRFKIICEFIQKDHGKCSIIYLKKSGCVAARFKFQISF